MSLDPLRFVAVALAGWLNQQQQDVIEYLREENRVLREQLGNRRLRLNDDQRCRMATENRDWGYTRIRGALANLGHRVARGTIANILKQHGIEPAPARLKKTTWQEFFQTHWEVLAAADFFTVEVWTRSGLVRVLVLFVVELSTRRVEIAGISPQPDGAWMTQTARNLTDAGDGFLVGKKYLIHDRDPLFTREFQETLGAAGVRNVRLPARSPNLNAYAERYVRSIKESCLDRMILFGERSLRRAVQEFVAHCHFQRNHQGFDNQLIFPDKSDAKASAPIECRQRLGGMLKYYHRQAA